MNLTPHQEYVVESESPAIIVLGGAGTGKTTTAAFLARRVLETASSGRAPARALFLSFSRASVAQVLSRSEHVLGRHASNVEVTTIHAFAWRLIERWGNAIGVEDPVLFSPAEKKLFGSTSGLSYDELIPAALRIVAVPAVAAHLRSRWAIIVMDEFQDTSDEQWQLVLAVRGEARLVLLGDMNQCIYRALPNSRGVGPERLAAALALPDIQRVDLPDVSHRDPTQVVPAAASAIRDRDFAHPAVQHAFDVGALEVHRIDDPRQEVATVVAQIERLRRDQLDVGVFSHHIDGTASLSDGLNDAGIGHDIVGLPDAVDAALKTQYLMLRFACGESDFDLAIRQLAIFVAACERGAQPPPLALMIAGLRSRPVSLDDRLASLENSLSSAESLRDALDVCTNTHSMVGLTRGGSAWTTADRLLRSLLGPRSIAADTFPERGLGHLESELRSQHLSLLTYDNNAESSSVQLMGLYQTKGREVDAAVVVLRASDFYGQEAEPMPDGSKLLYVLLSRARKKTIVIALGRPMKPLVAPLVNLA